MNLELQFKFLVHKAYFDKGLGFTSYVKYMIAFFGVASLNVKLTMYIGIGYAIFCYIFGMLFYKYGWIKAEHEVANRFNLFMKELRENPVLNKKRNI